MFSSLLLYPSQDIFYQTKPSLPMMHLISYLNNYAYEQHDPYLRPAPAHLLRAGLARTTSVSYHAGGYQ